MVLRHHFRNFDSHYQDIVANLVNARRGTNKEISEQLGIPLLLVNHVLDDLESRSLLKMAKSVSGFCTVIEVSARLRRALAEQQA